MSVLVAVLELLPVFVAAKVAKNESLYRDINVTYRSDYRFAGRAAGLIIQNTSRQMEKCRSGLR